jgi:ketosteroid isomerase-like protein
MSAQNVELVRGSFEHFVATGTPRWSALHEDIEIHDHDMLDAREYTGHAGFQRWLEDWAAAWSQFSVEPAHEYIDAGADVVMVYRLTATGRASGVTIDREDAMVGRVTEGQIARIDYYNNRAEALKQVGLEG